MAPLHEQYAMEEPMKAREQNSPPERATYTVREVADALGIGMVSVYRLLKEGQLRRVKLFRRTVVPVKDVLALVERLAQLEK